jgi:ArsR family metal-binding transcriptional regulator
MEPAGRHGDLPRQWSLVANNLAHVQQVHLAAVAAPARMEVTAQLAGDLGGRVEAIEKLTEPRVYSSETRTLLSTLVEDKICA